MTDTNNRHADLRINGKRLWESLMEHGQIGATEKGGVCRLALTELDGQGRDLFTQWAKDAGCSIRVDTIGNIFARRPGLDPTRKAIMTGSHLDTQPTGGKFDGIYGVLAGLEVVRTLNDAGVQTEAPIEVAVWTNEEGSRFVPVMMGSGVYANAFPLEQTWEAVDSGGVTVKESLEKIGYLGTEAPGSHLPAAYFEAHIEQGPVLEDNRTVIGVVPGVLGIRWFNCVVTGVEAHAGPTPMALRKDALQVATRIMQKVVASAHDHGTEGRGTVGMLSVFPNSRNVIPGRVEFSIDLRNMTDELVDAMAADVMQYAQTLAQETGLSITIDPTSSYPAQPFDEGCCSLIQTTAADLGYSHMPVVSGAGHDAVYMAQLVPAGMIFVPCEKGISHNESEYAEPSHLEAGCNVLLHSMLQLANTVSA